MATRGIVPRANGEGSIGTEKKHWGGGFFDKLSVKTLEVIGGGGAENDAQPATVGWVKKKFFELVEGTLKTAGIRYNIGDNGYVCLGAFLGNIKIQWGYVATNMEGVQNKYVSVPLHVSTERELFSCGSVNISGGLEESNWANEKPIVNTMMIDGKIGISCNYFNPLWTYWIRWILIGI